MKPDVAGFAWGVLLLVAGLAAAPVRAEEYVLGPEDMLQVSVWMHPELERSVTVSAEGTVTYPPVGDLKVAGLTPAQLATRIGDKLSAYLRQTTTVTVSVTQYLSRSVFVQGAVARPGRYGFERLPGLIDVLSQAGGANPGADLSQVQIVRREGAQRRSLAADVASVLRDGDTSRLPALQPGDMIIVAAGPGGGQAVAGAGAAVLGQVNRPGIYAVADGVDVWVLLAQAGGLTDRGDLGRVRILSSGSPGPVTVNAVNLAGVLRHGAPGPVRVKPGDVVFVGSTAGSAWGRSWSAITSFLGVSRDLLNIAVLADVLRRE